VSNPSPEARDVAPENPDKTGQKVSSAGDRQPDGDPSLWREELAARVDRYRERRQPRAPRYPSLQLRFDEPALRATSVGPLDYKAPHDSVLPPISCQAVALDESLRSRPDMARIARQQSEAASLMAASSAASPWVSGSPSGDYAGGESASGKLIEFPRPYAAAPVPLDELAEPVRDRPRILEAPALAPPPPALGGITIEAPERREAEKRPGIDIPLQSAPLGRRILATFIDGIIIGAACALCGFIFWKVSAVRPPLLQLGELAAGVLCLLWAVYQYLLIVYSASTPGLRLARLELTNFDGKSTSRHIRRWRVLASFLSTASLGMGYAWVFLDEDSLCWHDRITHTYLAPKRVLVDR
jgi:uncharacterized RDD family membrane protein YckC